MKQLGAFAGIAGLGALALAGAVGCDDQVSAQSSARSLSPSVSSTAHPNGAAAIAALSPRTRAAPLIVDAIDDAKRTVLPGNTRGEVRPELDRGPVDDSLPLTGMQLQLRRSPEHEQAAEVLVDELHRPGSPQFHQWLTAEQYAEQFGVAQEDIAQIEGWLRAHGFAVHAPTASRMTINFSGTAGLVREAFGTEIHALEVKGARHIANVSDPSIPSALVAVVEGIVSLHDFRPRPLHSVRKSQYTIATGGVPDLAVVPADLATIYQFNPLFSASITGQGQTIALVEDSDLYSPQDWQTFRGTFGLDAYGPEATLETVHPGGCADPGVNADDYEAAIDVDWASAAAPSANLQLASCANTTTVFGGLLAVQNLLSQRDVPPLISMSYGECEIGVGAAANAAIRATYQQAALEGVSVFVSAGDSGAAGCDGATTAPAQYGVQVNALASTVYNVAVGGTDFGDFYAGTEADYWSPTNGPSYVSALGYVPEIPWNDSCASNLAASFLGFSGPDSFCASLAAGSYSLLPLAGSGGPSSCATGGLFGRCRGWKKPSWQAALGNPNDGVRDLPDVSLFASNGAWNHYYIFCDSDPADGAPCVGAPSGWSGAGGTSFAAPIMAGIQALVNQVSGRLQGNPAPVYYALAQEEYGRHGNASCQTFADGGPSSTCTFRDITVGNNDVPCTGPADCYAPAASTGAAGVLSLSDRSYEPAFASGVGWDFATGLGSVNVANLVLAPIWKRE